MTFDEALLELAVDRSADSDAVRRAYLKLIKVRKPEADPEGFKRAREAYERVRTQLEQASLPFASFASAPKPQRAEPEPQRAEPEPQRAQPERQRAEPEHASGSSGLGELPPPTLEELRARLASLPPGAAADAPVAIAREAVAAHPGSYEALRWLVQALLGADLHEEAIERLRAAAGTHPRALEDLASIAPSLLTDPDLEALARAVAPDRLWSLVERLCELDLGDRAAQLAWLTFDRHEQHSEAALPPPGWLVMMLLRLHETGAAAAATRLTRRYAEWIRTHDLERALAEEPFGKVWPLVLDLAELPEEFPRLARSPLARAVGGEGNDLESAFGRFAEYDRAAARRCADQLRAHAPRLSDAFRDAIRELVVPGSARRRRWWRKQLLQAGVTVFILAALGGIGYWNWLGEAPRTRVRSLVFRACKAPTAREFQYCDTARKAAEELQSRRCRTAKVQLDYVDFSLDSFGQPRTQDEFIFFPAAQELREALWEVAWRDCQLRPR